MVWQLDCFDIQSLRMRLNSCSSTSLTLDSCVNQKALGKMSSRGFIHKGFDVEHCANVLGHLSFLLLEKWETSDLLKYA